MKVIFLVLLKSAVVPSPPSGPWPVANANMTEARIINDFILSYVFYWPKALLYEGLDEEVDIYTRSFWCGKRAGVFPWFRLKRFFTILPRTSQESKYQLTFLFSSCMTAIIYIPFNHGDHKLIKPDKWSQWYKVVKNDIAEDFLRVN